MTILLVIVFLIVLVTCSVSAYLIGFSRGVKGQKEVTKHIYIQEEKQVKKRGFASEEKIEEKNISKRKRYTIN